MELIVEMLKELLRGGSGGGRNKLLLIFFNLTLPMLPENNEGTYLKFEGKGSNPPLNFPLSGFICTMCHQI